MDIRPPHGTRIWFFRIKYSSYRMAVEGVVIRTATIVTEKKLIMKGWAAIRFHPGQPPTSIKLTDIHLTPEAAKTAAYAALQAIIDKKRAVLEACETFRDGVKDSPIWHTLEGKPLSQPPTPHTMKD